MQDQLDRKPKEQNNGSTMTFQVGQPEVTVRVPEIKVPEIKVPESNVNVDMSAVATAIESLAQTMAQLAAQNQVMLQELAVSNKLIEELAKNVPNVEVKAPTVKLPPRPREYDVMFIEDEDGVAGMKIRANLPN
jgi:hypothetical protein